MAYECGELSASPLADWIVWAGLPSSDRWSTTRGRESVRCVCVFTSEQGGSISNYKREMYNGGLSSRLFSSFDCLLAFSVFFTHINATDFIC